MCIYCKCVGVGVRVLGAEKDKHPKEKLFTVKDSIVFGTRSKGRKAQSGISLLWKWGEFQKSEVLKQISSRSNKQHEESDWKGNWANLWMSLAQGRLCLPLPAPGAFPVLL